MKVISTGTDRFLTSDAVADAVLEFAGVLARAGTADTIAIPFVQDSGEVAEARLLLGPASQISLLPGDDRAGAGADAPPQLDDGPVLEDLHRRTVLLEPAAIPEAAGDHDEMFLDFDSSN